MNPPRRFAARAVGVKQSSIREVTRRVEAVGGVNLGQGTCALPPHPAVISAVHNAIDAGHHSYTLFDGVPPLKRAICSRYQAYNGLDLTTANVLVTSGATGGLECACKCFLEEGDECILFEPIYQYHVRLVLERGAVPRFVQLRRPDWSFDEKELERAFSDRTKLVIIANPNNPTGKVFTRAELEFIGRTAVKNRAVVVSDEVYEYLTIAPGAVHTSIATLPGMFEHTITLSSASKTLFCTGWRVGWCVGPTDLIEPLGVKSDETYVCAPAPLQHAVAEALQLGDSFFEEIRTQFVRKCDLLCEGLQSAGLVPLRPEGAYYVLADYRGLGLQNDVDAMNTLIDKAGVGSVPGNAFTPSTKNTGLLRFCFALENDEIEEGCDRLQTMRQAVQIP